MMVEGPSTPQKSVATKMIETVLGNLEPEGFDLAISHLEASEEATSGHRGLKTEDREVIETDNKDKKVFEVTNEGQQNTQVPESSEDPITSVLEVHETHISTSPTTIDNLSTPFFEVGHLISSPIRPSSSPCYYTKFTSKRFLTALPLIENPESNLLTSENHPFFQGLQSLSSELKSFYNQVLAIEGDIFERCSISFFQLRLVLLKVLYDAVIKLEKFTVLIITTEVISEVAEVMGFVENVGIRIDWLDRLIGEMFTEKERNELMQEINMLRLQVEEAEKFLTFSNYQLKQAEEQLREEGPASIRDYVIKVLKNPPASR